MRTFRCKQCGSLYEAVPTVCVCGNNNLSMWEAMDPSGGYPQYGYPAQPANNGWQQPVNSTQQQAPAAPQWQQPAYATPQPPAPQRQTGGGKKKNTALIAVILAVVLIGLGVGGYFLWQHFNGDSPSSSQDDDDKEKDKEKDEDKDEDKDKDGKDEDEDGDVQPALSGSTVSYLGATITLPEGFVLDDQGENYVCYYKEDQNVFFYIEKENINGNEYESLKDLVDDEFGYLTECEIQNVREFTICGTRGISLRLIHTSATEAIDYMFIQVDDYFLCLEFYYYDRNGITDFSPFQASLKTATLS